MRNKILILFLTIVSFSVSAQEASDSILRSKKGTPILPKAGDWAIGADALPYLEYLGNMFNNTDDNTLDLGSYMLYGRYFLTDNTAVRFAFGVEKSNSLSQNYIQNDAANLIDPLSNEKVIDNYKSIDKNLTLDLGYQIFRGYGRLRGFYGFHVGYRYSREKYIYSYGNKITQDNQTPSIYYSSYTSNNARILDQDNGINQSIMAGLIAGVEYYFLPKICIGGEITFTGYHSWSSQGNSKYERWNGSSVVEEDVLTLPKCRNYSSFYTQRPFGGGLYLMFHF